MKRILSTALFFLIWTTVSFSAGRPVSLVRSINIEADKFEPYSARIQWAFLNPPKSGIFIGRSNVPLINEETLQKAVNITGDGLSANALTFLDKNLPNGVYYYIVLTGEDLENKIGLPFTPNENFSTIPFIVDRTIKKETPPPVKEEKPAEQKENPPEKKEEPVKKPELPDPTIYMVRNLSAVSTENSVKLNWQPAPSIGIRYNIYRSTVPLNQPAALRRAKVIGTASENTLYFEDPKPPENQDVFYAVTVTPLETGEEKVKLQYGQSYISYLFRREKNEPLKEEQLLPENLRAETFGRNAVRLSWDIPQERVLDFKIYRSVQPITNNDRLLGALYLGSVSGKETDFIDRDLEPGQYFYAVLPRDGRGKEIFIFSEGKTFTGFAGTVRPDLIRTQSASETVTYNNSAQEKPVYSLQFLRGEIREKNAHLFWDGTPGDYSDTKLYIYRGNKPLRNQYEIERQGILISIERPDRKEYVDRNPGENTLYYAVQVHRNGTADPKLVESVNFLKDPLIMKTEVSSVPEDKPEITEPGSESESAYDNELIRKKPPAKIHYEQQETNTESDYLTEENDYINQREEPIMQEEEQEEETTASRKALLADIIHKDIESKNFARAVRRLAPLTSRKLNSDPETRSTALFYTAICYYNMGDYNGALDLFSHPEVQKAYPMRWNFWYRRSLEKINPPGIHLHP
jgi:hypothetical protein